VEDDNHFDPALGHLLSFLRGQDNCEPVVLDVLCEYAFTERMAGRSYRGIAMFQANILRFLVQSQFVRSQSMFHPDDASNLFVQLWDNGVRPGSVGFLEKFLSSSGVTPPPDAQEVSKLESLVGGEATESDVDLNFLQGSPDAVAKWAKYEMDLDSRKSTKASGSDMSSSVVSPLLLWRPSDSLILELVYRFLEFLGSPIDDRSSSSRNWTKRLSIWRSAISSSRRRDAGSQMMALLCCHCLLLLPLDPVIFFALVDATGSPKICKRLLQHHEQDWRFWVVYADLQWKRKKFDVSRKVFFEAKSHFPTHKIAILSRLAYLELLRGQEGIPDAMEAFGGMGPDAAEGNVLLQARSVLKYLQSQIPSLQSEDSAPGVGGICSSFFAAVWTCSVYESLKCL
jgi:hypothetical protein